MDDLTSQSWFGWAVALVVGVPVVLLVLTELHGALVRRGNGMARPVAFLRNFVVPTGALLLLLTKASEISAQETWVQIIATVFGFLLLLFGLASLNAALFSNAQRGSWRQRMPSIFVDLGRLVIIVTGLALMLSWIWDANVGGLFAALGVTSIVIGLALQNSVGSIISGLLLLFEQPFQLGDWLDTGSVRGRVVQVNWRAVHIDTANGIYIVPNAQLAGAAFTNLSEPSTTFTVVVPTKFDVNNPPGAICALLDRVAADLPTLAPGARPSSVPTGAGAFTTSITVPDAERTEAIFLTWIWYAARRAGLHLDGAADVVTEETVEVENALRAVAESLYLAPDEVAELAPQMRLQQYGDGETIQRQGLIPDAMRFVVAGRVSTRVVLDTGATVPDATLEPGQYFGVTTLTREPTLVMGVAVGEVTTLKVPRDVIDKLVQARPVLAQEIGQAIDRLRERVNEARGHGQPHAAREARVG